MRPDRFGNWHKSLAWKLTRFHLGLMLMAELLKQPLFKIISVSYTKVCGVVSTDLTYPFPSNLRFSLPTFDT